MAKRIYTIQQSGRTVGLVRAASPAQALRHHTAGLYTVEVASQDDLVAALTAGISVAEAGREAAAEVAHAKPVDDGHDGSEQ